MNQHPGPLLSDCRAAVVLDACMPAREATAAAESVSDRFGCPGARLLVASLVPPTLECKAAYVLLTVGVASSVDDDDALEIAANDATSEVPLWPGVTAVASSPTPTVASSVSNDNAPLLGLALRLRGVLEATTLPCVPRAVPVVFRGLSSPEDRGLRDGCDGGKVVVFDGCPVPSVAPFAVATIGLRLNILLKFVSRFSNSNLKYLSSSRARSASSCFDLTRLVSLWMRSKSSARDSLCRASSKHVRLGARIRTRGVLSIVLT